MYFESCGAVSCSATHFLPSTFDIFAFSTTCDPDAAHYFIFMDSMCMDSTQTIPPSLPTTQQENDDKRE